VIGSGGIRINFIGCFSGFAHAASRQKGWLTTTAFVKHIIWTRHGTDHFLGPASSGQGPHVWRDQTCNRLNPDG